MTGRGLLAIGILTFQLAGAARANDDLAGGVKALLMSGWKPSVGALAGVQTRYAALARRSGFDARAKYAFALVLIEQRQPVDARRVLGEVLAERPEMLPAWQAKIWAGLVSQSYLAALGDMRVAAGQMAKLAADSAGADRRDQRALAGMLGRGVGFLQTTKPEVPAATLKSGRDEILAKMGADRATFLASERMFVAQITALDEKLATAAKERAATANQQQQQRADRKRVASKQVAEAEYQTLKSQADGAAQVRSADWEVEQIQTKLTKAQFDGKAVEMALTEQNQYITLQNQHIQRLNPSGTAEIVSGSQLDILQRELQQMQITASRLLQQRLAMEAQIEGLKTQLNAAMMMRGSRAAETAQTNAQLSTKTTALKQKQKKMDSALKRAPPPRAGKPARASTEQRRSFSDFDPFPLRQEKERVLAWFNQ